jgi:hypothetical protein
MIVTVLCLCCVVFTKAQIAIVSTPSGNQSVSQPSGTQLYVNTLKTSSENEVINALTEPGAPDIGLQITAAISQVGCGEVYIPAGTYTQYTSFTKPRCVLLRGAGSAATYINWTASSGIAVVVADNGADTFADPSGATGIEHMTLSGTAANLAQNSSIGLWIGGTTSGQHLGWFGQNQHFYDLKITGFGYGIEYGTNAFVDTCASCNIGSNYVGITSIGPTACQNSDCNSGEKNSFISSDIFNNAGGAIVNYPYNMMMVDTSIDYNNDGTSSTLATHAAIMNSSFECHACHFEQKNGAFVSGTGNFALYGGDVLTGSSSSDNPVLFSTTNGSGTIVGTNVYSGATAPALAQTTGGSSQSLAVIGTTGNGNGNIQADISAASNGTLGSPTFNQVRLQALGVTGSTSDYLASHFYLQQQGSGAFLDSVGPDSSHPGVFYLRQDTPGANTSLVALQSDESGNWTMPGQLAAASVVYTSSAPATSSAPCRTGQTIDAASGGVAYHYYCLSTNTWVRVAMSSF